MGFEHDIYEWLRGTKVWDSFQKEKIKYTKKELIITLLNFEVTYTFPRNDVITKIVNYIVYPLDENDKLTPEENDILLKEALAEAVNELHIISKEEADKYYEDIQINKMDFV